MGSSWKARSLNQESGLTTYRLCHWLVWDVSSLQNAEKYISVDLACGSFVVAAQTDQDRGRAPRWKGPGSLSDHREGHRMLRNTSFGFNVNNDPLSCECLRPGVPLP